MTPDITDYNQARPGALGAVCAELAAAIAAALPEAEARLYHGAPVWFLAGNPIVGYAVRKADVQLLFWSGQSFTAPGLVPEGKFKAAGVSYTDPGQIDAPALRTWLDQARDIQWDYKSIVKRKGVLEPLTGL